MNRSKHIYTRLTSAMVIIFGSAIFTLVLFGMLLHSQTLAAPQDIPDPQIRAVTFVADNLALFDPTDGVGIDKTIFFSNTLPAVVTVTFNVSGTAPLTLTAGAAFMEPQRILTNTISPWEQAAIPYTIPADAASQPGVIYEVKNANNAIQQIQITYAKDVTAPTSAILFPEVGYVTGATLLIAGTATDNAGGSGIKQVQILTGTGWVTAIGDETWQYEWTLPEADGEQFTIYARAEDNVGNWQSVAATRVITVDNVLPGNPVLASVVPTDTWTNIQSIPVTWDPVTDGSGVTYYYLWNQEDGTEIDENTGGVSATTATAVTGQDLPDGDNWLHLRTRDGAGNWAEGTVRIGPFKLDREIPEITIATDSQTITQAVSTVFAITGSVTDATGSGTQFVTVTIGTVDYEAIVNGNTWAYDWSVPEGDGDEYGVTAVAQDHAGNQSNPTDAITLTVDNTRPGNPNLDSIVPTDTWTNTESIPVTWTAVADGSGVTYYYLWNQENGTDINANTVGVITTTATAVTGENLPDGDNWLHLRTRDGAGNWAEGTVRIGPFRLDTETPHDLVLVSPIVTTTLPFTVSWSATDAISGIAAYSLDYQRADQDWTPWLMETTKTADLFTGERGYTYTIRVRASDYAGNWSPWVTSTTQIISYTLYLPVTTTPPPVPVGSLTINSSRRQDITTFTRNVTLSLSATENPTHVRIWEAGTSEPTTWEPYAVTKPRTLSPGNGLKTINVRYQGQLGGISPIVSQSIFLLQNGDFQDGLNGWPVSATGGLEFGIVNNKLRLGKDTYACNGGVPVGYARAQLTLTIPQTPGYELRFSYKVHTQDQLGGADNGRYDSFDVHINTPEPPDILRAGNSTQSVNCPNWFTVSSPAGGHPVPLDPYSGQITIYFTNWSRADGWYNTYTDLERVWIVKK